MGSVKNTVAALSVAAILPIAGIIHVAGEAQAACPPVMHFAVGGVNDPRSEHVPGVPSGARTNIHYSASLAPAGAVGGDRSVAKGERKLDAAARAFRAACPGSQIEVTGYSMGALVAGNVRDKWNSDPVMNKNVRVVLVSDPRGQRGAMNMVPSFIPGFTHTGVRPDSVIPTSSTCRPSDFICDAGNFFQNPGHAINAGVGYLVGDHGYKNAEVDRAPGHHVVPGNSYVPSTPVPWNPPTPFEVFEPVARAVVPDAPISPAYSPTPVREFLPPVVKPFVPKEIGDTVLPPLPVIRLPKIG